MKIRQYELVRECVNNWDYNFQAKQSDQVADFLCDCMKLHKKERENLVVLSLDSKGQVTGVSIESIGSLDGAMVSPREIFKQVILSNAAAFIVAHNHPSGDTSPSDEDKEATKRLKEAGDLLGVRLLDHIIIGSLTRHYSFFGNGLI